MILSNPENFQAAVVLPVLAITEGLGLGRFSTVSKKNSGSILRHLRGQKGTFRVGKAVPPLIEAVESMSAVIENFEDGDMEYIDDAVRDCLRAVDAFLGFLEDEELLEGSPKIIDALVTYREKTAG